MGQPLPLRRLKDALRKLRAQLNIPIHAGSLDPLRTRAGPVAPLGAEMPASIRANRQRPVRRGEPRIGEVHLKQRLSRTANLAPQRERQRS